ncbi:MAG TPA: hypothetical protein VFT34_00815 [Verrucomicrobiae bacterium]|nr:hypothetical protein [Verrucomicrobiae bacterium]
MNDAFNANFPGSLFWKGSLLELLQERSRQLCEEVDRYGRDFFLSSNLEGVADALAEKHVFELVRLHRDRTEIVEHGQTTIDEQKRTCLHVFDACMSMHSAATYYKFSVPFDGDGRLLMRRPSEFEMSLPWGEVVGNELHVLCKTSSRDRDAIRSRVDDNLNRVGRWLDRANKEVARFNSSLRTMAIERLQGRKTMLLQNAALAESLGFPIRARSAVPSTFKVPVHRKRLPVVPPSALGQTAVHDPYIDTEAYDDILRTIGSMTRVLELNPKAFTAMDEEALRFMLLVPLNSHYEGQATGETFNYEGKTDIIIKVGGRNIFIAECLVWGGAEYFNSKIEQLLGYTSWRDTKTAIIIFNRNKNLSGVLSQIPGVVKAHPNCKHQVTSYKHETGFRFMLHHRDDKQRDFALTVLVFDVPA